MSISRRSAGPQWRLPASWRCFSLSLRECWGEGVFHAVDAAIAFWQQLGYALHHVVGGFFQGAASPNLEGLTHTQVDRPARLLLEHGFGAGNADRQDRP